MRTLILATSALILASSAVLAQAPVTQPGAPGVGGPPPGVVPPPGQETKKNANPCRDEVAAALTKLRKSSWFRMNTTMITESGPSAMVVDYVLPDKMYQKVTQTLTKQSSEVILIAAKAWGNQGAGWQELPGDVMNALRTQMYDNVIQEQAEVGEYACKGRVQIDGRDALSYKLEEERDKNSTAVKNEAFRMFYVDAVTGLPLSNALLVPGRENSPLFKATYSFPLDMKIEPPKDVVKAGDDGKK
ncbi:MAG: hypothetical protein HOP09_04460 [Hyphomicrobium sp.]|nr:hypothetical protein [Hyphomicrobium sp.]